MILLVLMVKLPEMFLRMMVFAGICCYMDCVADIGCYCKWIMAPMLVVM